MNAGLKRQARIVEVAPDLAVKIGDRAQFLGIEQMLGDANQTFVRVHFDLRIADLPRVAEPAEPDLDTHGLLGQILAHVANFNQSHRHSCHFVFLLSCCLGHSIPDITPGPDLERHASTRTIRRVSSGSFWKYVRDSRARFGSLPAVCRFRQECRAREIQ